MSVTRVPLVKGEIYRIIGPASVKVTKGRVYLLGFTANEGERLVIPRHRIVALKPLDESEIELLIGEGGGFEKAREGEEVIDEWTDICSEIIKIAKERGVVKVLVLGAVDVGKSSFCTFLANRGLEEGLRVAVIDGDIGQADIGPPSCISMAIIDRRIISLRQVSPISMRFIGIDAPANVKHLVLWSLHSLLEEAVSMNLNLIIVNTDGWVWGHGAREYKLCIVQALMPDIVVAICKSDEIDHITSSITWCNVVKAPSPPASKRIQYGERKSLRESGYLRFLQNFKVRVIDLKDKPIINAHLFSGKPLSNEEIEKVSEILNAKVIYAERSLDHLIIVVEKPIRITLDKISLLRTLYTVHGYVRIVYKGYEKGLLIGLLDKQLRCKGIGIIEEFDYVNRKVKVKTPYEGEVKAVHIGKIRLSEDGRELEKLRDIPY